ncbi:hypothetical protein CLHUN_00140 [Ruminiclostridium hungatei]|uniref:Uncharacterized protein n=1 Tax=Ruminiclostridium hungatei TaxID=48256 RepID=A0A1V4SQL7_RUMHU|nr:hypothetical protein [Ruminiclostridium hungatei]OPX46198.1 hypothetical protein CLHUN_00140 [Ruminiclostridium hungatei]
MIYIYFILALVLSMSVECFTAFLLYRSRKLAYCIFLCNLLTNPPLNLITLLVQKACGHQWYPGSLMAGELAVVIIEGFVIKKLYAFDVKKALVLSFILNTASFITGLLILYLMNQHNSFL